ncbi:MAG TPA: hotdog domain-containing protein [Verrucomicrobiales bacterium]|nr:hotdog domain-containing protein [Verrucomicrobiales bacterium]
MENRRLVLPEHLNHYGFLFGGHLLKWVDETAWIAASLDYPGRRLVTVAMDQVVFHRSVHQGEVLRFVTERTRIGRTSVSYRVEVFSESLETGNEERVFATTVTEVRIDDQGRKQELSAPW